MATSKHFPVQKYSPRSDSDDCHYNETPYNSVSSFKSYDSNLFKNSVTVSTPYNKVLDDGTSCTPYNENDIANYGKPAVPSSCYIDNTVVSAYKGAKPPLPIHKSRLSKTLNSRRHAVKANVLKPTGTESQENRKFGIEHLQSISEKLNNANRELRKHRNSKRPENVSLEVTEDQSTNVSEIDVVSLCRDERVFTPDSQNSVKENGRHSSISRRRLPKVPSTVARVDQLPNAIRNTEKAPDHIVHVDQLPNMNTDTKKEPGNVSEANQLPNMNNDVENVPNAPHMGSVKVPTDNSDAKDTPEISGKAFERIHSLQRESKLVPKLESGFVKADGKCAEAKVLGNSNRSETKGSKSSGRHRTRDRRRSQSLGGDERNIAQKAANMATRGKMDGNDNGCKMVGNKSSANTGSSKSEVSSPGPVMDYSSRYLKDVNSKLKTRIISKMAGDETTDAGDQNWNSKNLSDIDLNTEIIYDFRNEKLKTKFDSKLAPVEFKDSEDQNGNPKKNSNVYLNTERVPDSRAEVMMQPAREVDSDSIIAKCKSGDSTVHGVIHKHYGHQSSRDQVDSVEGEDGYSSVSALNDIVDNDRAGLTDTLPENTFFTFDNAIIQELTDSVMEKKSTSNTTSEAEKVNNPNQIYSQSDLYKNNDKCNEKVNDNISDFYSNCEATRRRLETSSNAGKISIEGKSFSGKNLDGNVQIKEQNTSIKLLDSCKELNNSQENKLIDGNKENLCSDITVQKSKVERSPSYRKKVMARAKNRYKKSSMLKDCSCTKTEKGDIRVCQFCEYYDSRKRRSRSSLGLESAGAEGYDLSESEHLEISSYSEISSPRRAFTPGLPHMPSNMSPRPLRKLQISSRVDILMSSDLFRKHLLKHENLLEKHTMFRRTGMRKSVSNLDLSEGLVIDYDSQCETESIASETNSENNADAKEEILSQSHEFKSTNQESMRQSLTGDSDSSVDNFPKTKKKHFRTLPSSVCQSRLPIPSFTQPNIEGSQSRSNIPSFKEFKTFKELSKSTETLDIDNISSMEGNQRMVRKRTSVYDKVDNGNKEVDSKSKNSEINRTKEVIPLHLQIIKESNSRENVLTVSNSNDSDGRKDDHVNVKQTDVDIIQTEKELEDRNQISSPGMQNSEKIIIAKIVAEEKHNINGHELLTRQESVPDIPKTQQRVRPKLKSRTLPKTDIESDYLSDTANGNNSNSMSIRERRKPGAKRPRSLISKNSSLVSLIQESENKSQNIEVYSHSEQSTKSRLNLKIGQNVNRSKSDSKYEMEKGKQVEREGDYIHAKSLSLVERGKNSVCFDLDDASQCSPFDIGESETSTSMAGSLSDSIRSEVNAEDNLRLPSTLDGTGKLLHDPDDIVADDRPLKEELMSQVLRSTSDACASTTQEAARKRRERKERPYKSDPFSGTAIIPASKRCVLREERARLRQHMDFANSSREEILTFLDGVSHSDLAACDSFVSLEELNEDDEELQKLSEETRKVRKNLSNVSSLSTDSGVIGQDGSHDSQQSSPSNTLSHSHSEHHLSSWQCRGKRRCSCTDMSKHEFTDCVDCGPNGVDCGPDGVDCGPNDMIDVHRSQVCPQCFSRRIERKETIQEIMDTELNYGRDLNILKEEFYKPIMKAGLLNKEQLDAIFLNLDELLHVNKHFMTKLKSAIHSAIHNNDNEFGGVMIGCLFLESSTMFLTFENYCVNQAHAPVLLEQLEREKELLRIFLQVSQNDNQQLRKLHLKSFLIVPVQRIMKYPLLLDRLYKTTPRNHMDKNSLKEAKDKIEDILGHINAKARTTSFRQRKPSQKCNQHCSVTEKIEVSRVALDTLQWNRKDVCDVITSLLHVTQPIDHLWAMKKCKNYKFTTAYGVLLTLMQQPNEKNNEDDNNIIRNTLFSHNENNSLRMKSAAVVLIKEKNGRYHVMREPFMLEKCVVSQDPDYTDVFEILEWSKESILIKADTAQETKLWVQNLRQQMNNLGLWRRRRNALPNILLNHLS